MIVCSSELWVRQELGRLSEIEQPAGFSFSEKATQKNGLSGRGSDNVERQRMLLGGLSRSGSTDGHHKHEVERQIKVRWRFQRTAPSSKKIRK